MSWRMIKLYQKEMLDITEMDRMLIDTAHTDGSR